MSVDFSPINPNKSNRFDNHSKSEYTKIGKVIRATMMYFFILFFT